MFLLFFLFSWCRLFSVSHELPSCLHLFLSSSLTLIFSFSFLFNQAPLCWTINLSPGKLFYVINYVTVSQPDPRNGSFGPSAPRRFSRCFFLSHSLPGLMLPCLSLPVFVLSVSSTVCCLYWVCVLKPPFSASTVERRLCPRLYDDTQSCSMFSLIHIHVHTYFMSYITGMPLFHLTDTISIYNSGFSES